MGLNAAEKKRIASRERIFQDRLHGTADGAVHETRDAEKWINEWRVTLHSDEVDVFRDRLEGLGLTEGECRDRIRSRWPENEALPGWTHRLDELIDYVKQRKFDENSDTLNEEVPFIHVLASIKSYATSQVDWCRISSALSQNAKKDFEDHVQDLLVRLYSHTLFLEFKTYLAEQGSELAFADNPSIRTEPQKHYHSFVDELLDDGLKSFYEEYSVLARLTITVIEQWAAMIREFTERLVTDRSILERRLGTRGDFDTVESINFRGDPHNEGRVVLQLVFESGKTIAYKPRNLGPEQAYYSLISWINEHSSLDDLRSVDCVDYEEYGWMEWVTFASCESPNQVNTFYKKAGMNLCLMYALRFTDGHLENIIAEGNDPIPVDLETIATPNPTANERPGYNEVDTRVRNSVLWSGMLPVHHPDQELEGESGLGSSEAKISSAGRPDFQNINTDSMEMTHRSSQTVSGNNVPQLDDTEVSPEEYRVDIRNGFREMYEFLMKNQEALLEEGGPIDDFGAIKCRILYRSTHAYDKLLRLLQTPSYLRTGLKFGVASETLAHSFVSEDIDPEIERVHELERKAIWNFDVPRFAVPSCGHSVEQAEDSIEGVFGCSPVEGVRQRVRSLSRDDLAEQLDFLRLSHSPRQFSHPTVESHPNFPSGGQVTSDQTERKAQTIFDRIYRNSIQTPSGETTWHRHEFRNGGVYVHRIEDDLYSGYAGIGLFSAALASVTGARAHRDSASNIFRRLERRINEGELGKEMSIGAGSGLGSVIYSLTKASTLLDDPTYVESAETVASHITPALIEEDSLFDTHGGSAGAILGLLTLYEETGSRDILERAVTAGEHLLSSRVASENGNVWHTIRDRPLTGFAHGVGGIAYALIRLWDVTEDERFYRAACDALEFENAHFCPDAGNWHDLRPEATQEFSTGWCSGRSGSIVARLKIAELTGDDTHRMQAETALQAAERELVSRDHLCCGNFGRVEILQFAGRTLNDRRYTRKARHLASAAIERAESRGGFVTPYGTDHWYSPSLFTGESGIGYTLLRMNNEELPCVMIWE